MTYIVELHGSCCVGCRLGRLSGSCSLGCLGVSRGVRSQILMVAWLRLLHNDGYVLVLKLTSWQGERRNR
jgi:hypothetical protein